jgi:LPS O-antigen subunit length determinant protein (WzzB/FepE family)
MTSVSADTISSYYEKARVQLKADRDSIIQKIKDDLDAAKRKAISKA